MLLQSGPFSMALTTLPIQLSPCAIDVLLCWLFALVGVTTENEGKSPLAASVQHPRGLYEVRVLRSFETVSERRADCPTVAALVTVSGEVADAAIELVAIWWTGVAR